MLDVRFVVEGTPVAKGNMSGFPIARGKCSDCKPGKSCRGRSCFGGTIVGVSVTDQGGKELEAWQALIRVRSISARNAAAQRLVARPGAVSLAMVFVLARPGGHWTTGGDLSADGKRMLFPTVKPDDDKIARAVADGLTGALAEDDSQFTVTKISKVYAAQKGWTGVVIHARQVHAHEAWVLETMLGLGVWSPPRPSAQEALL
jgi:Holliday junction resolvase RusA-like endonuclease